MTGRMRMRGTMAILALVAGAVGVAVHAPRAAAQGAETAGLVTELKPGRGRVEVKPAAGGDWKRAAPLQALRGGDAVRATDDARVVLVMTGGGTVKVDAASSPFTVPAPRGGDGKLQKTKSLLEAGVAFFTAGTKEAPRAVLSTRSAARPPVVLSPRNGAVLPDDLALEWMGSRLARYTVRVVGPSGPVFERSGVAGAHLDWPGDAPALTPGMRYTVEVSTAGHAPQEAWFTVLEPARAAAVRRDLDAVASLPGASPNTLAVLRAGVLASEGLVSDARREVAAALAKDHDEPALHQLLGQLYQKAGLDDLAAESFDEADFLLTDAGGK